MVTVSPLRTSGTKTYCHAAATSMSELRGMARRLRTVVKQDERGYHLDLNEHQRTLAIVYGARPEHNQEMEETCDMRSASIKE